MGVVLAALLLGCSSQKPGAGNTGGAGGNVDGSNDSVATGQPVWTGGSQSISVTCVGFSNGLMGFQAQRSQLTDQQLALLDAMRTGPQGTPSEDGLRCSVSIVEMDGGTADYVAAEWDGAMSGDPPLITYATFQLFLATIPCLYSADEGPQYVIAPDARCLNGIFLRPSPGNADRFLTITDPVPQRHIQLDRCDSAAVAALVHLQVLAIDGPDGGAGTVLAVGAPVPAPSSEHTCQTLDVTFPAAGTYLMRVVIDVGLLASSASDVQFRFY